jgi:hypothetical protein
MWEVRAVPGRLDELVAFVAAHVHPSAQVFKAHGADPRVVVIDPTGTGVPDVPPDLIARAPHEWAFEEVPRTR